MTPAKQVACMPDPPRGPHAPQHRPFWGHPGQVFGVAVTSDGQEIVSVGDDGTVRVWSRLTGEERIVLTGHKGTVRAVAVTRDGETIVSGGYDGTTRTWNRSSGEPLNVLSGHTGTVRAVTVTRDGEEIVTAGHDGTIQVSNLHRGEQRLVLHGGKGPIEAITVTPDDNEIISTGYDGAIQVWSRHNGNQRAAFSGHGEKMISGVKVSPDGLEIATVGYDGAIEIRSCAGGAVRITVASKKGPLDAVALTSDGQQIVTAGRDGIVRVWSMRDGNPLAALSGHTGAVHGVATSGDQIMSVGADGTIRTWDVAAGEQTVFSGHTSPIEAVTADNEEIVTVGDDGTGRVWNRSSGALRTILRGHYGPVLAVALTADGKQVVTGGRDHTIRIWNRSDGEEEKALVGHRGVVRAVAVTTDGNEIVSTADDKTVRTWNRYTGEEKERFEPQVAGLIPGLAITPDDRDIIVTGFDRTIAIWDRVTGKTRRILTGDSAPLETVAVAHDNEDIVTGGDDGTTRIWNRHTGVQRGELTDSHGRVERVTVTLDGTEIVTAGQDGAIRIWERSAETQRAELRGHIGPALGLVVTPDGEEIVSTGYDGTIRVWNRRRARQVRGTELGGAAPAKRLAGVRSDLPSREDLLDSSADIDMLASLVAARTTEPPLSIALLGKWGSGKSSLMLQMEAEVERLAELSANNLGRSAFVANVQQVRFNAWHYSDDHLWSGLAEHLFRSLARQTPTEVPDPKTVRSRRDTLLVELSEGESKHERLNKELGEVDEASTHLAFEKLDWLARTGLIARTAARQLAHDVSVNRRLLILGLLAILLAVVLAIVLQSFLASIPVALSTVAAALTWGRIKFRTIHDTATKFASDQHTKLVKRRDEAARTVLNLREQLATVDAATRLSSFLTERAEGATYQQFRGVVGQIHMDLQQLDDNLREAHDVWSSDWSTEQPPLERIVLYIDDLDRCPPGLVVQVLAALNLLLALPLFVVVVAVDQRWLVRSLEFHHRELFGSHPYGGDPSLPEGDEIAALDYLDKVFQLPFALRPMRENASEYLQALLGPTAIEPERPPTRAGEGDVTREAEEEVSPPQDPTGSETQDDSAAPPTSIAGRDDERDQHRLGSLMQAMGEDRDRAAGKALRDLQPEGLSLRQRELDFMRLLGSLLPTPRAAKKLTNIYRLIRIGIPEDFLDRFIGDEETGSGPYQAVLVLLVITVGSPDVACLLFEKLATAQTRDRIQAVIRKIGEELDVQAAQLKARCGEIIDVLDQVKTPMIEGLTEYRRWAPHVARFSFYTRSSE